ncbi:hypothetical protein BFN03_07045 [Rhodococcus sp. WMMA185]|nr:hypothetical protein BFN03_07045 [Rhodococcus sp. WMMA185]
MLEVSRASADSAPTMEGLRKRWDRPASPVRLVVGYPTPIEWQVTVCGPDEGRAAISGPYLQQVELAATVAPAEQKWAGVKGAIAELLVSTKVQPAARLTSQVLIASRELRCGVLARTDRGQPAPPVRRSSERLAMA